MASHLLPSWSVVRFAIILVIIAGVFAAPCVYDISSREASPLDGIKAVSSSLTKSP